MAVAAPAPRHPTTTAVQPRCANRQAAAAPRKPANEAGSADRFLKLLVTQMQNQDPLNPMDNAQITSQMAQINTVNGIEKLNTTVAGPERPVRADAGAAGRVAGGPRRHRAAGNQLAVADGGRRRAASSSPRRGRRVKVEVLNPPAAWSTRWTWARSRRPPRLRLDPAASAGPTARLPLPRRATQRHRGRARHAADARPRRGRQHQRRLTGSTLETAAGRATATSALRDVKAFN
jgi:hypothetical protein